MHNAHTCYTFNPSYFSYINLSVKEQNVLRRLVDPDPDFGKALIRIRNEQRVGSGS